MATTMSIDEAIGQMNPVIIALAMKAPRSTYAQEWADGSVTPSTAELRRFEVLTEQFARVRDAESVSVARNWLLGSSIDDGDTSPIEALAADRFDAVEVAATNMIDDTWAS